MGIILCADEQKEVADRTRNSPEGIVSFLDWYDHFRQWAKDDTFACQLALAKQREAYTEIYELKLADKSRLPKA